MSDLRTMRFIGWIGSLAFCEFCRRQPRDDDRAAILEEKAIVRTRGGLGGGRGGRMFTVVPARQRFACETCVRKAFQFHVVE